MREYSSLTAPTCAGNQTKLNITKLCAMLILFYPSLAHAYFEGHSLVTKPTMSANYSRRCFLKAGATAGLASSLGEFSFLTALPRVTAEEAHLEPAWVRFGPEIEPLVRLVEDASRDRLLEEIAQRIHKGLSYREVLSALMLAGVRNIQPRPVGFKFHAVLVVNSAHLASLSSADSDRWLPIFWALDHFKASQAQNVKEGNWHMGPVDEARVPDSHNAASAFKTAMDKWDEAGADAAVVGLSRTAGADQIFELFARYCARDFREIGHKAIYLANSWRTLGAIGWQHAEPVLRSLAYAMLDRGGDPNPSTSDLATDRPWRSNLGLAGKVRPGWQDGKPDVHASTELLQTFRTASPTEASEKTADFLNRGVSPQSIYDALFEGSGELLMRRPGIRSLHALTSANALHYIWQRVSDDETRRLLLLQNASYLPMFRSDLENSKMVRIDEFQPENSSSGTPPALDEIFKDVSGDRMAAARKLLAYMKTNPEPAEFINTARRLVFLKGRDSHDYKFSSAVLEDFYHISPALRARYLAASVFSLKGIGAPDNDLVRRTIAALS
jgi:hypothetical protein